MAEETQHFRSPAYWQERIEYDLRCDARKAYEAEHGRADQLLNNELDLGLDRGKWQFKRSTWMKTFKHTGGRLFYGDLRCKVTAVEKEDEEAALLYEAGVNWEFTQPRGLYQKRGSREVPKVGESWLSYGLGVMNTRWDSMQRSRENPTGSIINEYIRDSEIILDGSAYHIDDIGHVGRRYQRNTHELKIIYPHLKEIPSKDGKTWVFDIQYRSPQVIRGKVSTKEMQEITGDESYIYSNQEKFETQYRKGNKGAKRADSLRAWESLKDDAHIQPIVYSDIFLCENELYNPGIMSSFQRVYDAPREVGSDFTYTFLSFVSQPNRPYPAGAAKFIYDDQVYEALLMTLYMEMLKYLNNTGLAVNTDAVLGVTDAEKIEEIKRFVSEAGYVLPLKNVQDINGVISQLKQNAPPRDMMLAADRAAWSGEDFFGSHPGQTGETPQAGTPFRSMALAQAQGQALSQHMVDSMTNFMTSVYCKNADLLYRFMPRDKTVKLVRDTGERKQIILDKEKLRKRNPQEFDIVVSIDTRTEAQKAQEKQEAMMLFQLGMSAPEDFLEDMGVKDIPLRLSKLSDYQRGQQIVAMEKEIPGLEQAINEAIQTYALENEER